jgi:hypothetical protein
MFTKIFVAVLLAASAAAAPAATESHAAIIVSPEHIQLHTGPSADITYLNNSIWAGGLMWNYPAVRLDRNSQSRDTHTNFQYRTPSRVGYRHVHCAYATHARRR